MVDCATGFMFGYKYSCEQLLIRKLKNDDFLNNLLRTDSQKQYPQTLS